ncbi:Cell division cycle protein 123-like [Glycine soja]|uniref:Cell division cycle protein 123-like n=1 Tax=Glycine soja TaxID=3848 RepID=A0A445GVY1_GLYSO|nr:Cell division cycle protein 123-like [Glycine soja]
MKKRKFSRLYSTVKQLLQNMKEEEVNRCQIQEWYLKFKSVSIKTLIRQLPESFIQYLLDDSGPFLLHVSVLNEDALPNRIHNPDEEDDFQVSEGSGDEAEEVFPKLNWSAPKDSAWISTTGPRISFLLSVNGIHSFSQAWNFDVLCLPLLFTWDELDCIHSEGNDMEFRIVEDRCAVRPGLKTAVPFDYLDTSPGSVWDQFLRKADDRRVKTEIN